ncbi:MAG: transposase domain-containing protein [Bacillota bacterium]|nr:transposase domain-containing protein [Bacillota bacterium]
MFADTPKGATASAAVDSLIETAKANGLDVYLYLQNLLANMTKWNHTDEDLEDLLPWSEFMQKNCTR